MLACYGNAATAATIEIVIDTLEFQPAAIKAETGDRIVWHNKDVMDHTATSDGNFDVEIPAGKSASATISKQGDLDYYCRYHPNMTGRIIVTK